MTELYSKEIIKLTYRQIVVNIYKMEMTMHDKSDLLKQACEIRTHLA